jgi:hypothetical protein
MAQLAAHEGKQLLRFQFEQLAVEQWLGKIYSPSSPEVNTRREILCNS